MVMGTKPSPAQLRSFGLTIAGSLVVVSLISWYRGHTHAPTALSILAFFFCLSGFVLPNVLYTFQKFWVNLTTALGFVSTRIVLTILFYAVCVPIGLIMKLFRDPLNRRLHNEKNSYWIKKKLQSSDTKPYENQF